MYISSQVRGVYFVVWEYRRLLLYLQRLPAKRCAHIYVLNNADPIIEMNTIHRSLFRSNNSFSFSFRLFAARHNAHSYDTTIVEGNTVKPSSLKMQFKTERKVGKTGVMLVGIGGNNGWLVLE